jgi:L-ascorbate metabolism protein UlaG (beta-lactamase superfamily)
VRDPEWSGETTLLFRVCDPEGACAEQDIHITITPVNDAPVLSIPDIVVLEGEQFAELDLAQVVYDPDHDLAELSWDLEGDSELAIRIDRDVASIVATSEEWLGIERVRFAVCDPEGGCAEQSVMIARAPSTLSVTLVGNAGYIIDDGRTRVAIDALLTYGVNPDVQQRMMLGEDPFAGIDLILVTHSHADHFYAACVARQMNTDPTAILVAPPDVVRQVRDAAPEVGGERFVAVDLEANGSTEFDVAGTHLEAVDFPHSEERSPRNVGFLIELAAATLFHPGDVVVDAMGSAVDQHAVAGRSVDVAFIPYFYLTADRYAPFVETIAATYIVPAHVGVSELEYVCLEASRYYGNTLCFQFPLQQRIIPIL